MSEPADWYELARYYDVLFSWDPQREVDFVLGASARYGRGRPGRSFEPFCGAGRLLPHVPGAVGSDLSQAMLEIARGRGPVFRADAARLGLAPESFDLAYCLIDSFRHLQREAQAQSHLCAVARALRPGGVYVLGFDVESGRAPAEAQEAWSMKRGGLEVAAEIDVLPGPPGAEAEVMRVRLRVDDNGRRSSLESRQPLRIWTPQAVRGLVAHSGLELVACFDRRYDLEAPRALETVPGSAVLVLRRANVPG
ncbi:MAG: class I SAM-dependent methyltransferase [Planctomycetes bacterium]|nr:class I SAM-dependent methyltransferase [Planctomycetota bacterium]